MDVQRKDGSRTLIVPVIKGADTMDFAGFREVYENLIRKTRDGSLSPDDLQGATDYYRPTDRGFEARLQERWTWLKGRLGRG